MQSPEDILNQAKQIKDEAKLFYERFKKENNQPRMAHVKLIFNTAEAVRYELEVDSLTTAPAPPWNVLLAIMKIGVNIDDSAEEELLPLFSRFKDFEKSYEKLIRQGNVV